MKLFTCLTTILLYLFIYFTDILFLDSFKKCNFFVMSKYNITFKMWKSGKYVCFWYIKLVHLKMYKNELNSKRGQIKLAVCHVQHILRERGFGCLMKNSIGHHIYMESVISVQIAVALKLLVIFQANSSTFSPQKFSLVNGAK